MQLNRLALALSLVVGVGLASPAAYAFNPGDLFVAIGGGTIRHFDADGARLADIYTGSVVPAGALDEIPGLCVDTRGDLLVVSKTAREVIRIDGVSGAYDPAARLFTTEPLEAPESCAVDSSTGTVYVGQAFPWQRNPNLGPSRVPYLKSFTADGVPGPSFDLAPIATPFAPDEQPRGGTDQIAVDPSNPCRIYWTSNDRFLRRFDVCAIQNDGVIHRLPQPPAPMLPDNFEGLKVLNDGEVMVVINRSGGGAGVLRYNPLTQEADSKDVDGASRLLAIEIDSSQLGYWVVDSMIGTVYHARVSNHALLGLNLESLDVAMMNGVFSPQGVARVAGGKPKCFCIASQVRIADPIGCTASVDVNEGSYSDNGDGSVSCSQAPPSPYGFNNGQPTAVVLQCIDTAENLCNCEGSVTILDNTGPAMNCPGLADLGCATADTFVQASAVDACEGPIPLHCHDNQTMQPVGLGGPWPAGDTSVTCTAVDSTGNDSACTFTVRRGGGGPLSLNCPGEVRGNCASAGKVSWSITSNGGCAPVGITCDKDAATTTFPTGVTPVTCTGTDSGGQTSACTFNVIIAGADTPTTCAALNTHCQSDGGAFCTKYQKYCSDTKQPTKCPKLEASCLTNGKYCDKYAKYCQGATKCQTLEAQCNGQNLNCDKYEKYCVGGNKPTKCAKLQDSCLTQGKYCDKYAKYCTTPAGPKPDKCDTLEAQCTGQNLNCDKFQKYCTGGKVPTKCPKLYTQCQATPGSDYCDKYTKYCTDAAKPDKCDVLQEKCQTTGKYCDKYAKYCTTTPQPSACDVLEASCFRSGVNCTQYVATCGSCPAAIPPVCQCKSVTVGPSNTCSGAASIDDGSYDPQGRPISCTQTPPGPYANGSATLATLTCTSPGGTCDCTGTVTVGSTVTPRGYDLYEDEEPWKTWEGQLSRAGQPVVWPFKLSQCFDNPPADQCNGQPIVDNPTVGNITKIEWHPNIEAQAAGNASLKTRALADWVRTYTQRGACAGQLAITSPTTASLPIDELEDPHTLASFFLISYTLDLGNGPQPGLCKLRLLGRFDDATTIAALPAARQPVDGGCMTCTGTGCGTCGTSQALCASVPPKKGK